MFRLDSEAALLAAFRPKDRDIVEVDRGTAFPLGVRHYFTWRQPAGTYVYVVFAVPGGVPTGIAFDTNEGGGASVPQMCDWCQTMGLGAQVSLLTAKLNGLKRVGVRVCTGLRCEQNLEEAAQRSGRSIVPAMEKLVARMGQFAAGSLKIDLFRLGP